MSFSTTVPFCQKEHLAWWKDKKKLLSLNNNYLWVIENPKRSVVHAEQIPYCFIINLNCWEPQNKFSIIMLKEYISINKLGWRQEQKRGEFFPFKEKNEGRIRILDYPLDVIIYICHCILCYSSHRICLSTACLSISENSCCNIPFNSQFACVCVCVCVWEPIRPCVCGRRESYLQLIPLTTESATSLAASSYTSFVLFSPWNTLSIAKHKTHIKERIIRS